MKAGGFASGSALFEPREPRHDRRTARILADYAHRLEQATDAGVLAAAATVARLNDPLAPELAALVEAQLAARHLSLAPLAGGPQ